MEAVKAVDSPQTKAPAPWLMRMSKLKPDPRRSSPNRLRSRACSKDRRRRSTANGYSWRTYT